ncbi:ABC transporter substrate-binding protein, partial [bacterium]|nr:ABC transporter substrate-binding protein [bacterium]
YNSPAEYEKATGKRITHFNEAPQLAELVKQGKLPSVEKRLPEKPIVIVPVEKVGKYGGTWRFVLATRIHLPHTERLTLYDPILRRSADTKDILPNLAESWKISGGGRVYTLYLRKGVKWSDGEPFTADDILFWYEDILNNKELTPVFPTWFSIGGVPGRLEKIDTYTIKITFSKPNPLFLEDLASPFYGEIFAPKHYLKLFHPRYTDKAKLEEMAKKAGFNFWYQLFSDRNDRWANPERPVLSAWKPVNSITGATRVIWERNPYYWKVDVEGNQLPYIDRFTVEIGVSEETAKMKAISGEIDMESHPIGIDFKDYPLFMEHKDRGNYRVILGSPLEANAITIVFNYVHPDPILRKIFNDRRFRIAMSYAINRDEIVGLLFTAGNYKAEVRQVAPVKESPFYTEELAKAYTKYDPKEANRLLDEMGLKRGPDGYRLRPDGKPLIITIETATIQWWIDTANLVAEYWKKVGINTAIKPEDSTLWGVRRRSALYDVTLFAGAQGLGALTKSQLDTYTLRGLPEIAARWQSKELQKEISPKIRHLIALGDQVLVEPDKKRREKLVWEILNVHKEELYYIGICERLPKIWIVKNTFRNVPVVIPTTDELGATGGVLNACQFYIEQ